jgi:hypothetical protein
VQAPNKYELARIWGLSLIVLTMAIHAVGMVTLALVGVRFRVRLEAFS